MFVLPNGNCFGDVLSIRKASRCWNLGVKCLFWWLKPLQVLSCFLFCMSHPTRKSLGMKHFAWCLKSQFNVHRAWWKMVEILQGVISCSPPMWRCPTSFGESNLRAISVELQMLRAVGKRWSEGATWATRLTQLTHCVPTHSTIFFAFHLSSNIAFRLIFGLVATGHRPCLELEHFASLLVYSRHEDCTSTSFAIFTKNTREPAALQEHRVLKHENAIGVRVESTISLEQQCQLTLERVTHRKGGHKGIEWEFAVWWFLRGINLIKTVLEHVAAFGHPAWSRLHTLRPSDLRLPKAAGEMWCAADVAGRSCWSLWQMSLHQCFTGNLDSTRLQWSYCSILGVSCSSDGPRGRCEEGAGEGARASHKL